MSRFKRFTENHPAFTVGGCFAVCVAFPFAYNFLLAVFH
jgi:hypothetical protein